MIERGGIAFDFIVASNADESTFVALGEDGISYELYQGPSLASAELKETDGSRRRLQTDGSRTEAAMAVPSIAPSNIVRVSLSRLDELMRMVGELVVTRGRLEDNLKNAEPDMSASAWRALQETNSMIERRLATCAKASCACAWLLWARYSSECVLSLAICRASIRRRSGSS